MPKYMILYNSELEASEVMASTTPKEMQASMAEWIAWRDEASKSLKVEFGLPLQSVGRMTSEAVTVSDSNISGYSTVEGESKQAVTDILKTHPHLKRSDSSIELLEMLPIPGL